MKRVIVTSLVSFISLFAGWMRTYGETADDFGSCIRQTTDSGYVITGATKSFSTSPNAYDLWLVKVNQQGDTQWTRTYGGPMNDVGEDVQQTKDGGYIITGYRDAGEMALDGDLWIVKADSLGDTVWKRSYGLPGVSDCGQFVFEMPEGYMVLGETESEGAGCTDVWILRIEGDGDTVWTKTYGESEDDLLISAQINHQFVYGYVLLVQSFTMGTRFVRIDTSGEVFSTDESPGGNINYIQERWSPGGYLCVGWSSPNPDDPSDIFLGATYFVDLENYDWTAAWGGEGEQEGFCVENGVGSNAYIVTGVSCRTDEYPDLILSERGYFGGERFNRIFGGSGFDYGYRVLVTPDNGYIVMGGTDSYGAGKMDLWLIKTDSLGNVGVTEPPSSETPSSETPVTPHLEISSPINSEITLRYSLSQGEQGTIELYDASGRMVSSLAVRRQGEVKVAAFSAGVYFARLESGSVGVTRKIVIVR